MFFKVVVLAVCVYVSSAGSVRRQLTVGGQSSATCDILCDDEAHDTEMALCGSNGVLYPTRCEFNNAQCKAHQAGDAIHVVSYGACVDDSTPCADVINTRCISNNVYGGYPINHVGGGVQIDSGMIVDPGFGHPYINTNMDSAEMVCGSDKQTYNNMCLFRTAQCQLTVKSPSATPLTLDHMGKCAVDLTNATTIDCSQYMPSSSTGLAVESGAHVTTHITCPRMYNPVCSVESRTFSSECSLCSYKITRGEVTTADPTVSAFMGICHHSYILG
ncbi:ovoinhibitor-like [Mya arenaria]|uniref:ovoinhibitor-like n=1 Tax=Mya arenaria TaxID=6604 RepID=UPI0022E64D5A|nr:ovoinhibitor-like [Mya arenaria]